MSIQYEKIRCQRCDEVATVTPLTAYEFEVDCRCESLISWAHEHEPPVFQRSQQEGLPF